MGAVSRRIESNRLNPAGDNSSILTGRQVWRIGNPARKQVLASGEFSSVNPGKHRLSGLLSNFKLNGSAGLALHDDRAMKDASSLRDILYAKTD